MISRQTRPFHPLYADGLNLSHFGSTCAGQELTNTSGSETRSSAIAWLNWPPRCTEYPKTKLKAKTYGSSGGPAGRSGP